MRETQVIEPIEILREIKVFPREFFRSHRPRQIWPKTCGLRTQSTLEARRGNHVFPAKNPCAPTRGRGLPQRAPAPSRCEADKRPALALRTGPHLGHLVRTAQRNQPRVRELTGLGWPGPCSTFPFHKAT
jgi:hypothetical protein